MQSTGKDEREKKWREKVGETRHLFLVTLFPGWLPMRLVFRSFNQAQCSARLIRHAGEQRTSLKGKYIITTSHQPTMSYRPLLDG